MHNTQQEKMFLLLSLLLLYPFLILKELFRVKNVSFFFLEKMLKIWVGRTTQKRGWP